MMNSEIGPVISRALKLVEPGEAERRRVAQTVELLVAKVRRAAQYVHPQAQVVLGGSYAKGTWLKGEADIDVFVKFPETVSRDELEKLGVRIGVQALRGCRPMLRYSEHPYVEASFRGTRVNVVACYAVKRGEWRSAADRSPFHTSLISESFDDNLRREARLLKKFAKGIGAYGAEVAVQGFSGYVCEVLIMKFGSFRAVLEAAARFKEGEVVVATDVREELRSLFRSPLVVLDPVDDTRNLGAAISHEKVASLVLAARAFLQRPDISYFKGPRAIDPLTSLRRSKLLGNLVAVLFRHGVRSVDILWGQLRRSLSYLVKQLRIEGFEVLRATCASNNISDSGFLFLLERLELPPWKPRVGPKVHMADNVSKFIAVNRPKATLLWISEDGRVNSLLKRRRTTAVQALQHTLSPGGPPSGIAPGLRKEVAASFRVLVGAKLLEEGKRNPWLVKSAHDLVRSDRLPFRPP